MTDRYTYVCMSSEFNARTVKRVVTVHQFGSFMFRLTGAGVLNPVKSGLVATNRSGEPSIPSLREQPATVDRKRNRQ